MIKMNFTTTSRPRRHLWWLLPSLLLPTEQIQPSKNPPVVKQKYPTLSGFYGFTSPTSAVVILIIRTHSHISPKKFVPFVQASQVTGELTFFPIVTAPHHHCRFEKAQGSPKVSNREKSESMDYQMGTTVLLPLFVLKLVRMRCEMLMTMARRRRMKLEKITRKLSSLILTLSRSSIGILMDLHHWYDVMRRSVRGRKYCLA